MAELTDSQLMAELQEFEDAQVPDQGEPAVQEKGSLQEEEPTPAAPDTALTETPALVPATVTIQESTAIADASAGASTKAAKGADPSPPKLPTLPAKKRGLTITKKATQSEAPDSAPVSKKLQARIVHDDDENEQDQASAVADQGANGQKNSDRAAECTAKGQDKKLIVPAKAAATMPVKTAKARGIGQPKPDAGGSSPKVKRAKSAYIFFVSEKRPAVKADHPELGFGELTKKLGEMWKAMSAEEKAPYEAMAMEDKNRAGTERAEAKAEKKSKSCNAKQKDSPAPKAKQQRAKTAYQLFCDDQRQRIKSENPSDAFGAINAKLAAAWKEASAEEKERYNKQHQELKANLPSMVKPDAQEPVKDAPSASHLQNVQDVAKARSPAADASRGDTFSKPAALIKERTLKRKAPSISQSDAADADNATMGDEAEESIEKELMDVDWNAHPAECIIAETHHAKYLVKRVGLDFSGCGLVDAREAKRQRLLISTEDGKTETAACPVTIDMMDEWDAFNRSFRCAVHAHSDSGELDMDDLNQDSPLEMCYWLGILREENFPLSKAVKNQDVMIKVPMMEISKVVQRVATVERKAAQKAQAAAEAETEKREKAEKALAAQEQEVLQLKGLLKEHKIAFGEGGQATVTEE
ncbi:probable high mobility group protein B2 at N-terminal half [Coccomyxa sp. Obi]|nr:probable high mobility group protein B2 at N-terminal half [Coccomyxa sp. Obi]